MKKLTKKEIVGILERVRWEYIKGYLKKHCYEYSTRELARKQAEAIMERLKKEEGQ
jgi:hypothetical protein